LAPLAGDEHRLRWPRRPSLPGAAGGRSRTDAVGPPAVRRFPARPGAIVARADGPSRSGLRPALRAPLTGLP
jgi:hypothetical protein